MLLGVAGGAVDEGVDELLHVLSNGTNSLTSVAPLYNNTISSIGGLLKLCFIIINSGMTLQDLENQGLLLLPTDKDWGLENASENLMLQRVEMWGLEKDNDNGICLYCEDTSGNSYKTEITHVSECLSRAFISRFFVECYGEKIGGIYMQELKIEKVTASVFALEFIHPFFANKRLREAIATES